MTLINYLTRVHFADRVLEEAVRSEVEALGLTRLLLVTSPGAGADTGLARLMAGLPVQTETEIYRDVPRLPGPASVAALIAGFRRSGAEAVIAYGSRSAINLAKLARLHLASGRPPGALPPQGGRAVLATAPPQLIAVPGIDGVGAAVSPQTPVQTEAGYAVLNRHDLLPAVAICDPTLTVGSSRPASASAAVEAIGACIEAFLSNVYILRHQCRDLAQRIPAGGAYLLIPARRDPDAGPGYPGPVPARRESAAALRRPGVGGSAIPFHPAGAGLSSSWTAGGRFRAAAWPSPGGTFPVRCRRPVPGLSFSDFRSPDETVGYARNSPARLA